MNAFDLQGQEIRAEVEGLLARVVQHETDHLDGKLFIDRLGPTAVLEVKPALELLERDFDYHQQQGEIPSDEAIANRLAELESIRT